MDRLENNNSTVEFETRVRRIISGFLKSSAFVGRKLTDVPTDPLMVVNRQYVTANGTTAARPQSPIVGQFYFDVSLGANGRPIWFGDNGWTYADGTLA